MTVALTDGPLGLEATHIWTPGDGAAPITLNDLSAALPRIEFTRMPGFRALPEADDNRQRNTGRGGESPLPGTTGGKTFTLDGFFVGRSMRDLRQRLAAAHVAFGERDLEGVWSAIPNPAYGDATHYWQTRARVLAFEPDEEFTLAPSALPSPYQLHFIASLRQSDPRFTWTDAQSATDAASVVVTNQGTAPASPVITIAGASGDVTVSHSELSAQLAFTGLPAGTLVINFAANTATIAGADVLLDHLDSLNSNWRDRGVPGLRPGSNTISQSGGTSITVAYKHTSW